MIKNIIFDFGGVLVVKGKFSTLGKTISKVIFKEGNLIERHIKREIKEFWNLWRTDQISEKEFFQKSKNKLNIKHPIFLLRRQLYSAHKPEKELFLLIKKLKQNYKIYLLSNHAREWFNSQNKKLKLENIFDGILISFQAKTAKPNIKIYKLLIKNFNLNPKECLFIDDQKENLTPAKKLGMKTIHYQNPDQLKKELKEHAIL